MEANNYFIEYVRKYLEERYGVDEVYKGGLNVHTTLDPHGSVSFVVTSGPYRFTRNPIYVGYLSLTVGIPLIFGDLWGVLLAPLHAYGRLTVRHRRIRCPTISRRMLVHA